MPSVCTALIVLAQLDGISVVLEAVVGYGCSGPPCTPPAAAHYCACNPDDSAPPKAELKQHKKKPPDCMKFKEYLKIFNF